MNKMKVTLNKGYKALDSFVWDDIPMFCVLMGGNGAGKTQLLKLLHASANKRDPQGLLDTNDMAEIQTDPEVKQRAIYLDTWNSSTPQVIGDSERESFMSQYVDTFKQYCRGENLGSLGKKEAEFKKLQGMGFNHMSDFVEMAESIPDDFYMDEENLFTYRLGFVFREYNTKRGVIALKALDGKYPDVSQIESKVTQELGEKPWDIFNSMMSKSGLEFVVSSPKGLGKERIILLDKTDRPLNWEDISSGEKVLIQLACWLMFKSVSNGANAFPTLLLLDEPDASLHPKMIRNMVSILNDSIVSELGIRVIMSTHSPTTVALAPEAALYKVEKDPTRITSVERDEAIEILSEGLIMVGVNTKYVFIEGKDDYAFYKRQYESDVRLGRLERYPSLSFTPISVSDPKDKEIINGGVLELRKTVNRLAETSLKERVRGIIDLDKGNTGDEKVSVLSRYAIENYIYDPLLIALALLYYDEHSIIDSLKSIPTGDYKALVGDPRLVQRVVDEVCKVISDSADKSLTNAQKPVKTKVNIGDEWTLEYSIPQWYVSTKKDVLRTELIHNPQSKISSHIDRKRNLIVMDAIGLVFEDLHQIFLTSMK